MSRVLAPLALLLIAVSAVTCAKDDPDSGPKPTEICAAPCTCDTTTACDGEGSCGCDPECGQCLPSCGTSCACDLTTACDPDCGCDPECKLCLPGEAPGPDGGVSGDGGARDAEVPEPGPDGGPGTDASPGDSGVVGDSCPASPSFAGAMIRICLPPYGLSVAGGASDPAVMSRNGRYVFFTPGADVRHMIPDDTNDQGDLIRLDLQTGQAIVITRGPGGAQSDMGGAEILGVSRDGTRVVFGSSSTNLGPPDDNGVSRDTFVWTEGTNGFVRYSETQFHPQSLQYLGDTVWPWTFRFTSDANLAALDIQQAGDDSQVVMFNFTTRQMELVSEDANDPGEPAIGDSQLIDVSSNGRWVAFSSDSRSLVQGYTGPTVRHMYLRDRTSRTTRMISVNSAGLEASDPSRDPSVSDDGKVAFETESDFITGRQSNGESDIVVYDPSLAGPQLVSVSEGGGIADGRSQEPQISSDGRFVVFTSYATNLVAGDTNGRGDVFVHDLTNGRTANLTAGGDDHSRGAQISADDRVIMFISTANNLVPGDGVDVGLEVFVAPNPLLP